MGVGGRCAGPRVDLPLHCYLLLRHKGTPGRAAPGRKARQRMSQLKLHREEEAHLSSMTTLSPMNTIYATGSLFSNPPPLVPSSLPHALPTITGTLLVFCVLLHLFSPSFFNRLNQERCSPSIANWLWWWTFITWQLGVYTVEMWDKGSVLGRGMRGSSSGSSLWSHIDCHKGWLLCTSFTEKLLEN